VFDYPRKIIFKLRLLVEGSNAKQKDDTHIAGNAANFRSSFLNNNGNNARKEQRYELKPTSSQVSQHESFRCQ